VDASTALGSFLLFTDPVASARIVDKPVLSEKPLVKAVEFRPPHGRAADYCEFGMPARTSMSMVNRTPVPERAKATIFRAPFARN